VAFGLTYCPSPHHYQTPFMSTKIHSCTTIEIDKTHLPAKVSYEALSLCLTLRTCHRNARLPFCVVLMDRVSERSFIRISTYLVGSATLAGFSQP